MAIVASRHALAVALALGLGGAALAQEQPAQGEPGQENSAQVVPDQLTDCMLDASSETEAKAFEELILALDEAKELARAGAADPALEGATNDKTVEKAEAMAAAVQKLARRACAPLLKGLPTEVYRVAIRGYMDEMGAETRARMNAGK